MTKYIAPYRDIEAHAIEYLTPKQLIGFGMEVWRLHETKGNRADQMIELLEYIAKRVDNPTKL